VDRAAACARRVPRAAGGVMRFVSTRGGAAVTFSEAVVQGLAPDGGLYVPERWPRFDPRAFDPDDPLPTLAARILRPFLEGDPLAADLDAVCAEAFDFPLPLVDLTPDTAVAELFHGPTAAFKDFGARFLARCLERRAAAGALDAVTLLVATSGDTGAAVAAACHRRPCLRVGVLFPEGGVSPRQEHQLTCWDGNVSSFAVRGTFDDCQRLVKQAFAERRNAPGLLSSANSINVGRLLPQLMTHAVAALAFWRRTGRVAGLVVPSGNVGNAVGALWAKRVGFPLREVALATNANRVIPDWFERGVWSPRPSVPTLANAMDVGDPSNMERVFQLYPDPAELRRDASSEAVDDAAIRDEIAGTFRRHGRACCPHTATALRLRAGRTAPDWIVVATAHPAKFHTIVEPLIGRPVEIPPRLAALLARPRRVKRIEPRLADLAAGMGWA